MHFQMYSVVRFSVFVVFIAFTSAIDPKSINVMLETRIWIEPKDNIARVLDNITRIIDKIKYALIRPDKILISRRAEIPKKHFTNLLNDACQAILNLKYEATQLFFKKLYQEIKYYFKYKGSAFGEIIKNTVVKKYIEETLKEWSETDPYDMKISIRYYMELVKNGSSTLNKLGELLNNVYDQKDQEKMRKFLDNLNKVKNCTREKHFAKIITAAIHSLIIKQYDRMNYTIRSKITEEINRLAENAIRRRFQGDEKTMTTIKIDTNMINKDPNKTHIVNETIANLENNSTTTVKVNDINTISERQKYENNMESYVNNSNVQTKELLKNITTTQVTFATSKVIKKFQLKRRVKINVNDTAFNTSVPHDINDVTTTVPHNINDVNITVTHNISSTEKITRASEAIDNGTLEHISTSVNTASVPQNINNGPNVIHDPHYKSIPILRINTIPVTVTTKSFILPELRVFGNRMRKIEEVTNYVPQNINKDTLIEDVPETIAQNIDKAAPKIAYVPQNMDIGDTKIGEVQTSDLQIINTGTPKFRDGEVSKSLPQNINKDTLAAKIADVPKSVTQNINKYEPKIGNVPKPVPQQITKDEPKIRKVQNSYSHNINKLRIGQVPKSVRPNIKKVVPTTGEVKSPIPQNIHTGDPKIRNDSKSILQNINKSPSRMGVPQNIEKVALSIGNVQTSVQNIPKNALRVEDNIPKSPTTGEVKSYIPQNIYIGDPKIWNKSKSDPQNINKNPSRMGAPQNIEKVALSIGNVQTSVQNIHKNAPRVEDNIPKYSQNKHIRVSSIRKRKRKLVPQNMHHRYKKRGHKKKVAKNAHKYRYYVPADVAEAYDKIKYDPGKKLDEMDIEARVDAMNIDG